MKVAQKPLKRVNPLPLQYRVLPFLDLLKLMHDIKFNVRVHYSTLEVLMLLVYKHYTNGKGCSIDYLMRKLYLKPSATHTRSIRFRLETLRKKGLVYSIAVKNVYYYYLSDKAKGILEEVNQAKSK